LCKNSSLASVLDFLYDLREEVKVVERYKKGQSLLLVSYFFMKEIALEISES
jgi:hypothetical protein